MYASFFGLNEKPFSITPDPRYLFLSERHAEALAHLVYGINEAGGFIQLTGEVGTGKTTVVRSLLAQAPKHAEIALILNPRMTPAEFLLAICEELGLAVPVGSERSLKDLVDLLSRHLLKAHSEGKRIVLVVDEAQNLAPEVLEQVRLLTNLETETQKLLQIILIGQPELRELLGRVELRQLAQRITGRYHLDPLSGDEAAAYVRHRLRVAGATRDVFTAGALREIQHLSGGVPRLINIISDRALLGAFTEDRHVASASVTRRAAGEVFGKSIQPRWLPWAAGSAVAALAVVSAVLLLPRFLAPQPAARLTAAAPVAQPAPAPQPAAPDLDKLLGDYAGETDPDNAFNKLFALWGLRYVAGHVDPCSQALQAGLECLTQRGSLAQLRLFNRPAVLNVIDSTGRAHQLVLAGLDDEHAQVDLGGAQREIGIGDLSRAWFGDYVLLWRPAAGGSQPLALGARDTRVRWLRDSLRRVNGLPADESANDRFDAELATLVEDFQRKNRLAVDGIAGVQTQVALDAALNDSATPFLRSGSGS
ncbi:MAG TPA: AAA family ATPase [Steroidobacteraceae bacterium]|jgi:general secretion pathway protein A|nr:AAA family ATPase [Steroidobacteraceae bacterium]